MKTAPWVRTLAVLFATGLATSVFAGPDKPGIPEHPKAPQPEMRIECTPKPGTESMDHAPKDHPMPQTRGMKNMDPALHMQDCVNLDAPPPPADKVHDHRDTKG